MFDPIHQRDERRAVVVEVGDGPDDDAIGRIRPVLARGDEGPANPLVYLACRPGPGCRVGEIVSSLGPVHGIIDRRDPSAWSKLRASLEGEGIRRVAFLPEAAALGPPEWRGIPADAPALRPWLPDLEWPSATAREHDPEAIGWIASAPLIDLMLGRGIGLAFDASRVIGSLLASPIEPLWLSSGPVGVADAAAGESVLRRDSKILAIVPHHRCEPWLARCLDSLAVQARPPDAIVVIDDASASPPGDIVARHPGVTLLRARENVGPYNLIQTVIDATDYDGYLFQDADDWSTRDRLQLLLEAAADTGAEWIGSQELRLDVATGGIRPVYYPLDVNRALSVRSGHPLLHPTSLVARSLIRRLGGFATGLRYGGDTEFLGRAEYTGRIVNIPRFCYVRRVRPSSLTTDPATGFGSPGRLLLRDELRRRAEGNAARVNHGRPPLLAPLKVAAPAVVDHILGPHLHIALRHGSGIGGHSDIATRSVRGPH